MYTSFLLLLILLLQAGSEKDRLFTITRNKNDNIVCYDAVLKDKKLSPDDPLAVYWIIPSENNKVEELNRFERRRAYGFDIEQNYAGDSLDVRLKPLPRTLRVTTRDGRWVAVTTIDSSEAVLTSVYVMADESGVLPKVQWVKISGVRPGTLEEVSEVIKP